MKAFFDWKMEREVALEACPKDLLERGNLKDLVRSLFAAEARNDTGDHYTPTTISRLCPFMQG